MLLSVDWDAFSGTRELVFDAPKSEVDYVIPKIQELMIGALPLSVPMEVEVGTGQNWLQAH